MPSPISHANVRPRSTRITINNDQPANYRLPADFSPFCATARVTAPVPPVSPSAAALVIAGIVGLFSPRTMHHACMYMARYAHARIDREMESDRGRIGILLVFSPDQRGTELRAVTQERLRELRQCDFSRRKEERGSGAIK